MKKLNPNKANRITEGGVSKLQRRVFDEIKVGCFVQDYSFGNDWGKVTKKLKTVVYVNYNKNFEDVKYDKAHANFLLTIVKRRNNRDEREGECGE